MAWTFKIAEGVLLHNGLVICDTAYSGYGAHANQPADESLKNLGPIPEGTYTIGPPECCDHPGPHGPYVMHLAPNAGTSTFGRSGFMLHGDNSESNHSASRGCIILPKPVRVVIGQSGDDQLEVVA